MILTHEPTNPVGCFQKKDTCYIQLYPFREKCDLNNLHNVYTIDPAVSLKEMVYSSISLLIYPSDAIWGISPSHPNVGKECN